MPTVIVPIVPNSSRGDLKVKGTSHYVTNKGDNYLFYWIDQDDTNNRWMFIRTDYDNIQKYTNKKQTLRNVLSSPLDDIVYTVDIDEESNHHNFQAHSIEDLPEDYLPTEDSYYEFEQPCPHTP